MKKSDFTNIQMTDTKTFSSLSHLRNFIGYLFNENQKFFNEYTKINQYYDIENGIAKNLNIDLQDRTDKANLWFDELSNFNTKDFLNDIVYFELKTNQIEIPALDNFVNYVNSKANFGGKARILKSVMHLNQGIPHIHRIILKG